MTSAHSAHEEQLEARRVNGLIWKNLKKELGYGG